MPIVIPQSAYPLSWPAGVSRTPERDRKDSPFHKVQADQYGSRRRFNLNNGHGITKIRDELAKMGAVQTMISSNLQLRSDGFPYADGPQNPGDVGVAVYWARYEHRRGRDELVPFCMPCDKWNRIADNLYAIGMSIEALRGMERWGCVSVEQAFAGFAALPPGSGHDSAQRPWRVVFDVERSMCCPSEICSPSCAAATATRSRSTTPTAAAIRTSPPNSTSRLPPPRRSSPSSLPLASKETPEMPRVRHNDSGDPANDVCGNPRCRHVRAKHDGGCTGKRYDPFNNVGDSCRCKAFVEPKPKPVTPPGAVELQASWRGDPPVAGDYLMSPVRPRFAYRIIEILGRKDQRARRW
jgi:hypothetical protein